MAMDSATTTEALSNCEMAVGIGCWMTCSVGMLVFNKLAISAFPVECTLVAMQMAAAAVCMLFCWSSIHIGSWKDVARWSLVTPFFTGMLLTSILALKHAPMTLVISFRAVSPLVSLMIERFYPNPLRVTMPMLFALGICITGMLMYATSMDPEDMSGVGWVMLNAFFAIGDRLLQRMMLAKDQSPVDISKTGVTLLNNVLGMIPLIVVALAMREYEDVPGAVEQLTRWGAGWVVISCAVGVGISYSGIWVQSLISATSFLVLVNANKFFIIFLEVTVMHTKTLTMIQVAGAMTTIFGSIAYAQARQVVESEAAAKSESTPLVSNGKTSGGGPA